MKLWKQVLVSAILFVIAFVAWAKLYPGADSLLARYGIDWFSTASTDAGAPARGGTPPARGGGFSRQALVVTAKAATGVVNDRLTAIGTGQAVRTVSVRPLVAGQIAAVPVVSGVHVEAGDVILRLDSAEEELDVERARLTLGNAERKAARLESLYAQRAVSSVDLDTARSELSEAQVALRAAELALQRRTVTAPISGSLGILAVNVGDYVTTSTEITTIDDRSQILVEFFVPERFAARMAVGKTVMATAIARPGDRFDGEIVAVDNRVDEASRTLRVQARIANDQDLLRAGMSFEVTVRFKGETWPSVDPLAIQWDSAGSYVWRVGPGNRAERVDVAIVQRNADRVLVKADIAEGDDIIIEGVQSVRDGAEVRIAGAAPDETGAPRPGANGGNPAAGQSPGAGS
ncbi:MAG: efflux RND transporter periplasmic adaptor subunit [Oricola sp.]